MSINSVSNPSNSDSKTLKFSIQILEGIFFSNKTEIFNNPDNPRVSDVLKGKILTLLNGFVSCGRKWLKLIENFKKVNEKEESVQKYHSYVRQSEVKIFNLLKKLEESNDQDLEIFLGKIKDVRMQFKLLRDFIHFKIKYYKYSEEHDEFFEKRGENFDLERSCEGRKIVQNRELIEDFVMKFGKSIGRDDGQIGKAIERVGRKMGMVGKAEVPENREVKERFVADMMRTKAERKEDKRGFYRKKRLEKLNKPCEAP
jgi:hypothetical protein